MSDRKTNDFFNSWGQQRNPIRQSDMSSMFGSAWRCQKKWHFSHLYHDDEVKRVDTLASLGIVAHNLIHEKLTKNRERNFKTAIKEWKEAENSDTKEEIDKDLLQEYEYFLKVLYKSKAFKKMQDNLVFSEKSFMVKIGDYWCAGTVDCIVSNGSSDVTIIDHKTGTVGLSQWEMSHTYQSLIYAAAVRYGYFFDRPDSVDTGHDYFRAFVAARKAKSLIEIGIWPRLLYGYYRDYCIAKKKSVRMAKHIATKNWKSHPVGRDGKITIKKGDQRGPVWYPADVSIEDLPRLEHSLKVAVAKCKAGIFDETFSELCERCYYREKCMSLGKMFERKRLLHKLVEEMGIDPD